MQSRRQSRAAGRAQQQCLTHRTLCMRMGASVSAVQAHAERSRVSRTHGPRCVREREIESAFTLAGPNRLDASHSSTHNWPTHSLERCRTNDGVAAVSEAALTCVGRVGMCEPNVRMARERCKERGGKDGVRGRSER
eukprot:6172419-Pleurochrysis_carterae.AAC.2